jgi:hypothetical protein
MGELKYATVMRAEQEPDVYDGENCNEHRHRWETYCEGDKDSDGVDGPLTLDPKQFMPGTRVIVQVPCCPNPECGLPCEVCDCGFDWKAWADNEYC